MAPTGRARPAAAPVAQFLSGVRLLGRGLALCLRMPGLLALGLIPVLVTALLFATGFGVLLYVIDDLAGAVTWFADDWPQAARTLTRVLAGLAMLGSAVLLAVVSFTVVALAIGDPFYERISERVEQPFGGAPEPVEPGFWRELGQSVSDSARLLGIAAPAGIALALAGFVPVVGQTVVPVLGTLVGGWFLAVELVGIPLRRRGLRLADQRRALRTHRAAALGFGTAVFVCFLVPGGAVLVMPAAVAGGTLLARRVLGLPPGAGPGQTRTRTAGRGSSPAVRSGDGG